MGVTNFFHVFLYTATVIVLLCTAIVQPYGKSQLLNYLELLTLTAIFMTLWAGNVFNANPRCEDGKGGTVAWCDTISVAVGAIVIIMLVAVVATMVYYKKQKQMDQLLKNGMCCSFLCSSSNQHQELGSAAASSTMVENPSVDRAVEMTVKTQNTRDAGGLHGRNVTHIPDNWDRHVDEETGEKYYEKPDGSTQWDRPPGNDGRWERHETEDGEEFFVGPNGNSTWDIP